MATDSKSTGDVPVEGMMGDVKDAPPEKTPGLVAGPYTASLSLKASLPPDSQESSPDAEA